jgi:hypothetical protein
MLAHLPDLILDDVIVVAEPVFGRDRMRVGARAEREDLVGLVEPCRALVQARQERPRPARVSGEGVRRREGEGVRFELFGTEEGRRRWRVLLRPRLK